MKKKLALIAVIALVVAVCAAALAGCGYVGKDGALVAKHYFTVMSFSELPEGVQDFNADRDYYKTESGGRKYVLNSERIRFSVYLKEGYEIGTLKLSAGGTQYDLNAYEDSRGRTVYRASFNVFADFDAVLVGETVKAA